MLNIFSFIKPLIDVVGKIVNINSSAKIHVREPERQVEVEFKINDQQYLELEKNLKSKSKKKPELQKLIATELTEGRGK